MSSHVLRFGYGLATLQLLSIYFWEQYNKEHIMCPCFSHMETEAKKGSVSNLPNIVSGRGWMQIMSAWQENSLSVYQIKFTYSSWVMQISVCLTCLWNVIIYNPRRTEKSTGRLLQSEQSLAPCLLHSSSTIVRYFNFSKICCFLLLYPQVYILLLPITYEANFRMTYWLHFYSWRVSPFCIFHPSLTFFPRS